MDISLNPTILVQYKAQSSKIGLRTILALTPFWALWAPWVAIWVGQAIVVGGLYQDASMIAVFCLMVFLTLVSAFTLFVCLQNKFVITRDGIKFPLRCLFELRFRLFRPWQELKSVRFIDTRVSKGFASEYPDSMNLTFKDGGDLPLSLSAFRREDLQNFLMALQSYVPELPMSPPLAQVHLGVSAQNSVEKALTFTQIWEEDMASRFGSTVFVPLEPGQKLQDGRLEIMGQIAFGGLSAVYLAKNKDEQLCVVKEAVVPRSAEIEAKEKALELFKREAQLLMGLDHPRIADVMDNFVEEGRHYMLLEFIDGKDLRRYVKENGPQHEKMVLRWAKEIAEVLTYLHGLEPPIIHRDLTPDNLVLEADGGIAIIDFGAANEFLGTATGTLVGKQSYISPEQFRGKSNLQSDLYSLGATMFFLLTGKDPEALSQSRPREHVPQLSDAIDNLVAELTAMDCQSRIKSASELLERCKNLLAAESLEKAPRGG